MKQITKREVGTAVLIVLVTAAAFACKQLLADWCQKTNSPFCILLDMSTDVFFCLFVIWIALAVYCIADAIRTRRSDREQTERRPAFTVFKSVIFAGMVILCIPLFLPFTGRFGGIKVNGRNPIRLKYYYYLLHDAISGETDTVTVPAKDFQIETHSYAVWGGRYSGSTRNLSNYAVYEENSVYLYSGALKRYIAICQNYQKDLVINYYRKSGIIRTIDDYLLYDRSAFDQKITALEEQEKQKQEAEEAAQKEQEEKHLEVFSAFFHSEGENYEEIVRDLERRGLENTYDTIYISTQYFETGEIALFDNTQNVIYVVRDNNGEDMVEIPPLPYGGTLTEVTEVLDEAGIKWTYHCFGCKGDPDTLDHSKDILHTVHCSPGTPIPKDYVFWFSVYHVGS